MNAIYKIIGQDGKEYGPITAEQLRQWIAEGRLERQTPVFVAGAKDWNFIGLLPEFVACFEGNPPIIASQTIAPSAPTRKTNGFAIAGLVCGILSLICCSRISMGTLGIIFSLCALWQINREPERYNGRELAIAGIILSIVGFLIIAALIIFWLAIGALHFP
jgi:hypothetical protein